MTMTDEHDQVCVNSNSQATGSATGSLFVLHFYLKIKNIPLKIKFPSKYILALINLEIILLRCAGNFNKHVLSFNLNFPLFFSK